MAPTRASSSTTLARSNPTAVESPIRTTDRHAVSVTGGSVVVVVVVVVVGVVVVVVVGGSVVVVAGGTEVVVAGGTAIVVDEAVGAALVVVDAGDLEADRTCGVLPPEAHAAVSTTTPRHMTRRDLIGSEQFEFVGSQPA